jgi:hypothetical protein
VACAELAWNITAHFAISVVAIWDKSIGLTASFEASPEIGYFP